MEWCKTSPVIICAARHFIWTLLLVITFSSLYPGSAISAPIAISTYSSMDITLTGVKIGSNSYQSLGGLLGAGGQAAVYASSGRSGLIDPYTSSAGSATASSALSLNTNGIPTSISDLCYCPNIVVPSSARSNLEVGDHLVSITAGEIELNGIGSAVSASAPLFQMFINNASSDQIFVSFDYLLTAGGAIVGTDPWANVGFIQTAGAGATQLNHDNYLDPIYTGGVGSSLFGGSLDIDKDFSISYFNSLTVRLDSKSLNYINFYNTHYARGAISEPINGAPVPEPSTLLMLGSGLAGLAMWRWKQTI